MKKHIMLVLTIMLVICLGGCSFSFGGKSDRDEIINEANNIIDTAKEEIQKECSCECEDSESKSYNTRLYKSEDGKYVLLLNSYIHSTLNPKGQNSEQRDFYLRIDNMYSLDYIAGWYYNKDDKLILQISSHPNVADEKLASVKSENAGTDELTFDYTDEVIKFSDVNLYLVK